MSILELVSTKGVESTNRGMNFGGFEMKRGSILAYELTPTALKELVGRLLRDTTTNWDVDSTPTEDYAMDVLCWIDELMTKVESK